MSLRLESSFRISNRTQLHWWRVSICQTSFINLLRRSAFHIFMKFHYRTRLGMLLYCFRNHILRLICCKKEFGGLNSAYGKLRCFELVHFFLRVTTLQQVTFFTTLVSSRFCDVSDGESWKFHEQACSFVDFTSSVNSGLSPWHMYSESPASLSS